MTALKNHLPPPGMQFTLRTSEWVGFACRSALCTFSQEYSTELQNELYRRIYHRFPDNEQCLMRCPCVPSPLLCSVPLPRGVDPTPTYDPGQTIIRPRTTNSTREAVCNEE